MDDRVMPTIIVDVPSLIPTEQAVHFQNPKQFISVSMPSSPSYQSMELPIQSTSFNCQLLQAGLSAAVTQEGRVPCNGEVTHNCYGSFNACSTKFGRELSSLFGKKEEIVQIDDSHPSEPEDMPTAHYYFDALEGPELESLKVLDKLILPEDEKWPFLLRFPISSFAMSIGVGIQAFLWKIIHTTPSMSFLHVSPVVNFVLWCISLALMSIVASIYSLKIIFYSEAVKREFFHPIRVNFFFAPWIGCILIAVSVPPSVAENLHVALWYVLTAPILCLDLKIYGEWMLGGERRLSKVANPTNHLSVVGNFAAALLGSYVGLKEGPVFFFAVGLAHYIVLFVTLYQRLPTNETLPKDLHPVFFLFIAGPSIACLSWTMITRHFDIVSRMAFFLSLFLYASLVVRVNFFRGFRFSLAWWAYIVPMTSVSIAAIKYTSEVNNHITRILGVGLSFISALTVSALLISTILHAFVFRDLFPNDMAIAITVKRQSLEKRYFQGRTNERSNNIARSKTSV